MSMRAIDITTPEGTMDAQLFQPDGQGPWPAVIMITDAFGPRPTFDSMGHRLATAGYSVLIPNPFYRLGRAPVKEVQGSFADEEFRKRIFAVIGSLTPERTQADIGAALDFLAQEPSVKKGPAGIVGYCMGGSIAMRAAAQFPERIGAAASYHGGRLATEDPSSPHRQLGQVKGELYFGHADNDASMDAAAIARLEAAIKESGVKATSELYVGARHGFAVEGGGAYDKEAAERHWSTMQALFDRTLKKA